MHFVQPVLQSGLTETKSGAAGNPSEQNLGHRVGAVGLKLAGRWCQPLPAATSLGRGSDSLASLPVIFDICRSDNQPQSCSMRGLGGCLLQFLQGPVYFPFGGQRIKVNPAAKAPSGVPARCVPRAGCLSVSSQALGEPRTLLCVGHSTCCTCRREK